jgi:hypothetical protein
LREYLAEVVVLPNSPLIGQEAFDSDFSALEFQVLKINRQGQLLDAGPNLRFETGDVVLVAGKVENLASAPLRRAARSSSSPSTSSAPRHAAAASSCWPHSCSR